MTELPYETINNNKEYSVINQNALFWMKKTEQELGVNATMFNRTKLTPQERYLELLAVRGNKSVKGSEEVVNINQCIKYAIDENNIDLINYLLDKKKGDQLPILRYAVKNKNLELTEKVIKTTEYKARYYFNALKEASLIGELDLVKFILSIGDNYSLQIAVEDLPALIQCASIGGSMKLIEYYSGLSLKHDNSNNNKILINEMIIKGSIIAGNVKLLDEALTLTGILKYKPNIKIIIFNAIINNQLNIIKYISENSDSIKNKNSLIIIPTLINNGFYVNLAKRYECVTIVKYLTC